MPQSDQARLPASSQTLSVSNGSLSRWFAEEVQPHERSLRSYLRSAFPSLPDVDDLVQESYARLIRAKDAGKIGYAKAFLFTTARRTPAGSSIRASSSSPRHLTCKGGRGRRRNHHR